MSKPERWPLSCLVLSDMSLREWGEMFYSVDETDVSVLVMVTFSHGLPLRQSRGGLTATIIDVLDYWIIAVLY